MKIKETIERDCCSSGDLKRYNGVLQTSTRREHYFCIHCGQVWKEVSKMDAAGGRTTEFIKVYLAII